MRAGTLLEKITVYRPTITKNKFGEQEVSYTKLYDTRARLITNHRHRENVDGAIAMPGTLTLQVRYYHDIRQNDVVDFKDVRYHIISVMPLRMENCWEVEMAAFESDNNVETEENNG